MESNGGSMWTKDVRVNFPIEGDFVFDDFFLIVPKLGNQTKVKKYTVWRRNENKYVSGLQFTY